MRPTDPATPNPELESVIWHDVENGAYAGDLPLWRELAETSPGPVLELGCGTGRVAMDLAGGGHSLTGVDRDGALIGALADRAESRRLGVRARTGDIREALPGGPFGLIVAPMQVIQLLAGPADRARALACARAALAPGGRLAIAIAEDVQPFGPGDEFDQPLPDVAEVEGWVYSSLPLEVETDPERIRIVRLRQRVDPAGALSDEVSEDILAVVSADRLEREAGECGLRVRERRVIEPTDDHLGSTVLILESRG